MTSDLFESSDFAKKLKPAIKALCNELDKIYPGISEKVYEKGDEMWHFKERIFMCVYIELIITGYIKPEDFE